MSSASGFWVTPRSGEDVITLSRAEVRALLRLIEDTEALPGDDELLRSAGDKMSRKLPTRR